MSQATRDLIRRYYEAFNAGDMQTFLSLLTDDVSHDVNQGGREIGRANFEEFMRRMNRSYQERIEDVVVMTNEAGDRAATEYVVHGKYLADDEGLPKATGQKYVLPGGAFFEIRGGKVARVTNYYNLQDWLRQVAG
jgi:steroid delta-isomerase-like uncharacterized protein